MKKKTTTTIDNKVEDIKLTEQDIQNREKQIVWGWDSASDVAEELWGSIHNTLLEGNLMFAYKSVNSNSDLKQIVVVQNNDFKANDFGVGMFTNGYSALIPHVPIDYLESEVLGDLVKYKVDKKIIETYKCIVEDKKKEITNN